MKKISYLLIGAISMLAMLSCEQDELDKTSTSQPNMMAQRIVNFKSEVELKSSNHSPMELDSMVWYVEAALNMTYGHPHLSYVDRRTDSLWVGVEFHDGCLVSGVDVANTYHTLHNFVAQQFLSYSKTDKHIVVVDVRKEGENADGAGIWVYSTVGSALAESDLKITSNPFQFYDYFHAWLPGRCNGYNNQYPTTDNAPMQLLRHLSKNDRMHYINNHHYYFTDIVVGVNPADPFQFFNNDSQTSNVYPTLVYFEDEWQRTCLSPADMFFLLDHIDDVLIDGLGVSYPGKVPMNIEIIYQSPVGKDMVLHLYYCDFAIKHYRHWPATDPVDPVLMDA